LGERKTSLFGRKKKDKRFICRQNAQSHYAGIRLANPKGWGGTKKNMRGLRDKTATGTRACPVNGQIPTFSQVKKRMPPQTQRAGGGK